MIIKKFRTLPDFVALKNLKNLHEQGICHKDFHSGNILLHNQIPYLTDFGLSGPANKNSKEIFGILTYVAPEVLKRKTYTAPADIYSFGIIMTELSTGLPPYYNNQGNDRMLALSICSGLRPDFGEGTPEVYKALAHECMDANANKRPTAEKLEKAILYLCDYSGQIGMKLSDDGKFFILFEN
ncbi:1476_t:CDS:2 [Funneliformis geosporum]|nr:1476_t:CDS:2 [Funneliformis geosporum]